MNDQVEAGSLELATGSLERRAEVVSEAPGARIAEEQLVYARVLDGGMKLGMLVLMGTFATYLFGVLTPQVPVDDLPKYWSLPVKKYLAATGIHPGWGWMSMLEKGDILNFLGIALLSSVSIVCYLAIIPVFFRKKDVIFGVLAIVEVVVLTLAASGILGGGGH
jgi:hypothetical protein